MKICQTLWCNTLDLLRDSFGWYSPFYNLIGWTYSCLKLKEYYSEVNLYTDSQGEYVLINLLNLPYDKVYVEYDNLKYAPTLWAFPKILTYSKQKEAFLHVDGDVFIFEKFSNSFLKSDLIFQNFEISTSYYKSLFEPILRNIVYCPEYFKNNLFAEYPRSCNAGILGGSNIDLLKDYSSEAIKFVDKNLFCHSNGNFNMIFEQLLLYSIITKNKPITSCYYNEIFEDNGYLENKVANLLEAQHVKFIHLLGPLKRNLFICEQLSKKLFNEYPEYFDKIQKLFLDPILNFNKCSEISFVEKGVDIDNLNFLRTKSMIDNFYPNETFANNDVLFSFVNKSNNPYLIELFKYEQWLYDLINKKFAKINYMDLFLLETKLAKSIDYICCLNLKDVKFELGVNGYIEFRNVKYNVIGFEPDECLVDKLDNDNEKIVACVPSLSPPKYKEVLLNQLDVNILSILYDYYPSVEYTILKNKIQQLIELENSTLIIEDCILNSLKFLIVKNLIYIAKL